MRLWPVRPALLSCLFAATLPVTLAACTIERRPAGVATRDDFGRAALGDDWRATGNSYRLDNGELVVTRAYNHPLWLTRPIPRDCVIELDAWSNSDAGDIKIEAWGDGKSFAQTTSYTATSYVFIFGGWNNTISAIARMNEHGGDRRTRQDMHVQKGKKYHFRIERKDGHLDWQVDGQPFLTFDDPRPLDGPDHAYLGFNDWEAELHFDNLSVTPL
jgi:hypothetical protein